MRVVLASKSPRRIRLLRQIGLTPDVIPSDVDEGLEEGFSPEQNALRIAVRKAEAVAVGLDDALVIAADTIVVIDGLVLNKPTDPEDAVRMLTLLSGRTHTVHTGFALKRTRDGREDAGVESTHVTFRALPPEEIEAYVAGGGPMDKAGAYGIQDDYGAVFVSRIEGCYYNVVGLPLSRVYQAVRRLQHQ